MCICEYVCVTHKYASHNSLGMECLCAFALVFFLNFSSFPLSLFVFFSWKAIKIFVDRCRSCRGLKVCCSLLFLIIIAIFILFHFIYMTRFFPAFAHVGRIIEIGFSSCAEQFLRLWSCNMFIEERKKDVRVFYPQLLRIFICIHIFWGRERRERTDSSLVVCDSRCRWRAIVNTIIICWYCYSSLCAFVFLFSFFIFFFSLSFVSCGVRFWRFYLQSLTIFSHSLSFCCYDKMGCSSAQCVCLLSCSNASCLT